MKRKFVIWSFIGLCLLLALSIPFVVRAFKFGKQGRSEVVERKEDLSREEIQERYPELRLNPSVEYYVKYQIRETHRQSGLWVRVERDTLKQEVFQRDQ